MTRMEIDTTKRERLLTVNEVAWHLRVDTKTVRNWVREGLLEAVELPTKGRRHIYRFRESTIDAFFARNIQ
jgi:excisionase family DNA binding protein